MYAHKLDLAQIGLEKVTVREFGDFKSTVRTFRIRQLTPGRPPGDLCLKLWNTDSTIGLLPEALNGTEIYSSFREEANLVCNIIIRDTSIIETLRAIENDILTKLSPQMAGVTEQNIRWAYGESDLGQLLYSRWIQGRRETVVKMDMSELGEATREKHPICRMVQDGLGFRCLKERGFASPLYISDFTDISTGCRLFPVICISRVECRAQSVKIIAEVKNMAIFEGNRGCSACENCRASTITLPCRHLSVCDSCHPLCCPLCDTVSEGRICTE